MSLPSLKIETENQFFFWVMKIKQLGMASAVQTVWASIWLVAKHGIQTKS